MNYKVKLLICCLFLSLASYANTKAVNSEKANEIIPSFVSYQGQLEEKNKEMIVKDITVTYYSKHTNKKLYNELHKDVAINDGIFSINLGRGIAKNGWFSKYKTLHDVFENNDSINMSFKIDGVTKYPMVGLLPAGHSMETTMAISGLDNNNTLHSKGYNKKGMVSTYQATVLTSENNKTSNNTFAFKTNPFTVPMNGPYLSKPARDLPVAEQRDFIDKEINTIRHETMFDKDGNRFGTLETKQYDTLADNSSTLGAVGPTPTPSRNFPGMGNINGVLPPDIEGAVGRDYYVQQVNLSTAIYNKSDGTIAAGPFNTNQLWSGFGGSCESDNSGDAIALYDEQANRWVLSQFAVTTATSVCFAVSETSDPTGSYYLYELPAQRFPDYYKLGVWPAANNNAYFMTTNSGFPGAYDVYAIDRESLLNGTTPRTAQFFQGYYNLLMPADVDGTPPADTTPGYLYTFRAGGESYFTDPTATDTLDIFEYNVDWATPANSTLTRVQVITTPELDDFNWTVCGFFNSDCLPQPDTSVKLDSGSWWPMQRLQYRKFSTHESLVGAWVVDVVDPGDRAAPRWFELNKSGANWTINQQGTYSPDAEHRFLPSISMDVSGGIGMVYSKVSSSTYASMYYTARSKDDPAGTMRNEQLVIAGAGSQTHSANRWGDYASMDIDPVDECTFWATSEHIPTTGSAPWATQITSFQLPDCASVYSTVTSKDICSILEPNTTFNLQLTSGFTGTTDLSVTDCPTGAVCNFSVNPIVHPNVLSTFRVNNLDNSTAGQKIITVTATDNSNANITNNEVFELNITDTTPGMTSLISPPNNTMTFTNPSLDWSDATQAQEYFLEIDDNPNFNSVDVSATISNSSFTASNLRPRTCYFWRVSPTNICGLGSTSSVQQFYTNGTTPHSPQASTDVPKSIATVPVTVTSTMVVSGVGSIADVNVVDLSGIHTYVGDLTFSLTSPGGTTINLMSGACGSEDNFDINFDDEAASSTIPCPPTDGGDYKPANPLSAFDGENADGTWTLTVVDGFNQDGGSLESWGLEFESVVDPGNQVCIDLIFDNGFDPVAN